MSDYPSIHSKCALSNGCSDRATRPLLLRTRATPTHVYFMAKKRLVLALYEVEGVKFGHFTLKSGVESPVYVDLRVMVAHPKIMVGGAGVRG